MNFDELSDEEQLIAVKRNKNTVLKGIVDMDTPLNVLLELQRPLFTRAMLSTGFFSLDPVSLRVLNSGGI